MKVIILAGGFGTRISEESHLRPKPMIEIGGMPILWHIMKIYSFYGHHEFIICLGYMGYIIKEYFANYFMHHSDVTFDFANGNQMTVHHKQVEPWKVTLVNTGIDTATGGRIKRVADFVKDDTFLLTYGDGVADVNIQDLVDFHSKMGKLVTVTATTPPGRFGALQLDAHANVCGFKEKPKRLDAWINAGFFVVEPRALDYIEGDFTPWESTPLEVLTEENQVVAFQHRGFWQPMDTLRDKNHLEALWAKGHPPWRKWKS